MMGEQEKTWDATYRKDPSFFGETPSVFCIRSTEAFKSRDFSTILELGAGQGRDTKYFIGNGFKVIAADYSEVSCAQLRQKFGDRLFVVQKDLRQGMDLPPSSIDGCYAHMLLTMDFTDDELKKLISDVHKALVPGGLFIFSVRNRNDRDCGNGRRIRDGVWKNQIGFNVRFFSNEEIKGFCGNFEILRMTEFSEGNKVLYSLTLKKPMDQ